jgi:hypothetical protein
MDRPTFSIAFSSTAQSELQFLLSLLNIATPGQPASEQTAAIQQLLPAASPR